jgi:hypothetical protein
MNPIGLNIKYVSYTNRARIPMTFVSTRPIQNLPVVNNNNNNNNNINKIINKNVNINNSIRSLIERNRKIVTAVSEYHIANTEQNRRKKMVKNAYTSFLIPSKKRKLNSNGKLTFKNFMNRINRLGKE